MPSILRSLFLPLLGGVAAATNNTTTSTNTTAATSATINPQWTLVQNGTTGILANQMIIVSPTLALLFDLAGTGGPLQINGKSAWGALYDLETNTPRAIDVVSDTFCASGSILSNGTMVSVGGDYIEELSEAFSAENGTNAVRIFEPCDTPDGSGCELYDDPAVIHLTVPRWYPSSVRIYDGSLIVVGGSFNFSFFYNTFTENSFEFWPPKDHGAVRDSPFLDRAGPANMFTRMFSLPDGTIFMISGNQTIIYDIEKKTETRLPDLPNNVKIANPFDGTAQMLPLSPPDYIPEVVACGGTTTTEGILPIQLSSQDPASSQCSRITLTPEGIKQGWAVEHMPEQRMLPEMLHLPTGEMLIINGGQTGYSGFDGVYDPVGNSNADHPNYTPTLYDPTAPLGQRMSKEGLPTSNIARMYHSTVSLTPSGSFMIAGSNPNIRQNLTVPYATEYRVEHLSPPYMSLERPILSNVPAKVAFNTQFTINIQIPHVPALVNPAIKVALMDLGYSSHSFHSSARLVWLDATLEADQKTLRLTSPPNNRIYPPGIGWIYVTIADRYVSAGSRIMIGNGGSPPVQDQGKQMSWPKL
uniref:Glyoxal oxidase n=1 Tax=Mycena chlorophos TaxID=658473 RepID=A0ABQ0LJK7_MYCCL|nr:predicted protein [Mycena chlorophos]